MKEEYHLELRAFDYARKAHEGQERKYTGEPYIWHPMAVAVKLKSLGYSGAIIAAALMHDVLEDTHVTEAEMREAFGDKVTNLVLEVTDVSRPEDGNRFIRKKKDLEHLIRASPEGQTIKIADLIDNTSTIIKYDINFAKKYIPEKRSVLIALTEADGFLRHQANEMLTNAEKLLQTI